MCGWKKVFQNSMQNFAFREGPDNAHKLHAARIIADFAYINLKSWRFCFILFCCFFYCCFTIQIKNVCFRIYVQCSGQNSANLAKGQLNLWGHRFSQNANQKLQEFLPYHTNKDHSTFFDDFLNSVLRQYFWLRPLFVW